MILKIKEHGDGFEEVGPKDDIEGGGCPGNTDKAITEGVLFETDKEVEKVGNCADDAFNCKLQIDNRFEACTDFDEWTQSEIAIIIEKEQGR